MVRVSKNNPFVYLTSVAHERLPVFQTDKVKHVVCKAFDEARRSGNIFIFAYVIMPDHVHLITQSDREPSDILRYLNGVSARRVIDFLKQNNFSSSLAKLRMEVKSRNYKHSVWQHHPDVFLITSEMMLMQKVNYIHQNPARGGLVSHPNDYLFSGARIWNKKRLDIEPIEMDLDKITWREAQPR